MPLVAFVFLSIRELLEAMLVKTWNLTILVLAFLFASGGSHAQANIYEWAYVNPANPTQGVVQSSVVCPGGLCFRREKCQSLWPKPYAGLL